MANSKAMQTILSLCAFADIAKEENVEYNIHDGVKHNKLEIAGLKKYTKVRNSVRYR